MRRLVLAIIAGLGLALLATGPAVAGETTAAACPPGAAQVASIEPIEVDGGVASVSFVLAADCHDVELSLLSYRANPRHGQDVALLAAATGRYSAGKVHHMTVAVDDECAYRVAFVTGPPDPVGHGVVIGAVFQEPDSCLFGAGPMVVVTPSSTTPPTTTTEQTRQSSVSSAAPAPARQRPAPARTAGAPDATARHMERAASSTAAPARQLREEAAAYHELSQADSLGGWSAGDVLMAALLALAAGGLFLKLGRAAA